MITNISTIERFKFKHLKIEIKRPKQVQSLQPAPPPPPTPLAPPRLSIKRSSARSILSYGVNPTA